MSVYVCREMEKVENRYHRGKKKEEDFFSVERKITLVHVGFYTFNFIGKSSIHLQFTSDITWRFLSSWIYFRHQINVTGRLMQFAR